MKNFATLTLVLLVVCVCNVAGQDSTKVDSSAVDYNDLYRLELHAIGGAGATRYTEPPSVNGSKRTFIGYNVNVRLMWHPDHLLSIGLMSGYQVFSKEKIQQADGASDQLSMELSSVPLHVVFEVRPLNIRFGAGIGMYLLLSQLTERGVTTHSSDAAFGGSAWIGYTFELSQRFRVGPDAVLQVVSDRGISNLSLMITLQYDLISY